MKLKRTFIYLQDYDNEKKEVILRPRTRKTCQVPPTFVLLKKREQEERGEAARRAEHTGEYVSCLTSRTTCDQEQYFCLIFILQRLVTGQIPDKQTTPSLISQPNDCYQLLSLL